MRVALANAGDLQIKLIEQTNDSPSMYRDFLSAGNEGLQHVAYWSLDFEDDLQRAHDLGWEIGQQGRIGDSGRFFEHIRRKASTWDGHHPIREAGPPE